MMLDEILFFLIFTLTSIVFFGAGIYQIIDKAISGSQPKFEKRWKTLLTLACILPVINLFLYYLLLLFHGFQDKFYIFSIASLYVVIFFIAFNFRFERIRIIYIEWLKTCFSRSFLIIFFSISAVIVIYCSKKTLTEFDYIEYGVQGKIFYLSKSIKYRSELYDPVSGFYFVGLHGYAFPLYKTLNLFFNNLFRLNSDLIFKAISSLYSCFIIFSLYTGLKSFDEKKAWMPVLLLVLSPGFLVVSLRFHIDTYRLFFTLISFLLFYISVLKPDNKYLLSLFGLILGFNSFAHSIGFIISVISLMVFCVFVFCKKDMQLSKVTACIVPISLFLLSGGLHYLLDIVIGTGWIFKSINFY